MPARIASIVTAIGNTAFSFGGLSSLAALAIEKAMSTITELNTQLNDAILSGKAMEAFEEHYDENVTMQENLEQETKGKAANRARELEFFKAVEAWHGGEVLASAVTDDVSFSEWRMDVTFKGAGRITMAQVAVRRWKDGKVVHERFYHK